MVKHLLAELGSVDFWKVAMKPAKPHILQALAVDADLIATTGGTGFSPGI